MRNHRLTPGSLRALHAIVVAMLAFFVVISAAQAQNLPTLKDDFRNVYRIAGGTGRPWPPTPAVNDPLPATAGQFRSATAFGTVSVRSSTAVLVPVVGQPVYRNNTDGSVRLVSASFGRSVVLQTAQFQFGEMIPVPIRDTLGNPVTLLKKPKNWPFRLDINDNVTTTPNTDFYYSADAEIVFASSPGVITIVWETATIPRTLVKTTYIISSSPKTTPRTMYWSELGFKGPKVQLPPGRVDAIRFAYNPRFPQLVATQVVSPHVAPPGDPDFETLDELRTLWFDNTDQLIHAYNWEGRIVVEYLGAPRDASGLRVHLGTEIVEVKREIAPTVIRVDIGEALPPQPTIPSGSEDLTAAFVSGLSLGEDPFVFEHVALGGTKITFYAIRTTTPTIVAGGAEVLSNEVLTYWLEPGLRGIRWPKYYAGYIITWPTDDAKFSLYARADRAIDDPLSTAVQLESVNNPQLVFQDDTTKQEAGVTSLNQFYTRLTGSDENRALIQYSNGDEIWFERVKSRPVTAFPGFGTVVTALVGERIQPPAAAQSQLSRYDDGDGDASNDVFVGYIRQTTTGRDFDTKAYKNPFSLGFEEAKKGAIIGVNTRPGNDTLEVWWYRKSTPPGTILKPTYWPAYVQRYQLRWPTSGDEIVLASNAGSNDIGLAGSGTIYFQNNAANPGYNPNEEHALMIGGRAFALRDDLNLRDANGLYTTSAPFVLVSYTEADQRPAMRVFRVLREKDAVTFNYPAIAGTPLGLPRPLADMPIPRDANGNTLNVEILDQPDLPPGYLTTAEVPAPYELYSKYIFVDRKQALWVYRGRHSGGSGQFKMRFKYATQPGFYFPDKGGNQPAVGTIVPFLRPLDGNNNPIGDSVTGTPLDIFFNPQWPASAPVLNVGETLTLARGGLPQVRGQSSAEVLYQQSLSQTIAAPAAIKSVRLIDPTVAKKFALVDPETNAIRLENIPSSVLVSDFLGRKYFPSLPPHLSQRLYYDPNEGATAVASDGTQVKGAIVFKGEFRDELFGADFLLPNVMSPKDLADAKALCLDTDPMKEEWDAAMDGLSVTTTTFIERTQQPGTYEELGTAALSGPQQVVEILSTAGTTPFKPVATPVDSYAISAVDGGEGFVVLAVGNGNGKTQLPGEPVSVQVFRVSRPLGVGELKVLTAANPLDEKVTLQHSLDFGGDPSRYEFQFITAPPTAGGTSPALYTLSRSLIVGNGGWSALQNPPEDFARYRGLEPTDQGFTPVALPETQVTINTNRTANNTITPDQPHTLLRRRFSYSGSQPLQLFFSIALSDFAGGIVYLNNAQIAVHNVAGLPNTAQATPPGIGFTPLRYLFSVPTNALLIGENILTIQLYSLSDGPQTVNARLEATVSDFDPSTLPTGWFGITPAVGDVEGVVSLSGKTFVGKVRHVVEGSSPQTLTDNYFSMRYREVQTSNDDLKWSVWTSPQLVEGWIKRVLAGINPFNQRVTDLLNNPVNTDVSLITQAGKRWEGDIALTLGNINDVGLIEIYETVLRRGDKLSISGAPRINNPAANDALLLAAGYLNDLYTLLGNEAYADAANPTIAIGTESTFGDVATSLFAFKGQLATVLDEELALLRGRDDSLSPGTKTSPVYNRLVWNYTRGILSGEAIYAVNYNISDADKNGAVDAADAARQFPQGHGDAYGHYLTSLTGYYRLLTNEFFSWSPRSEAVLVLGQPVAVDYFDERKFASAAANVVKTGAQVLDLTYRKAFTGAENVGWNHLRDLRNGQPVTNPQTLITRSWGVDDWACRAGQGALLHWVTANSGLPDVDPNPAHEGIQKVDRTTVPELAEIVAQAEVVQQTLDNANTRLNPLGLSRGVLTFDISPAAIETGKTHFEQVYERAIESLQNTVDAFNNAKSSSQFLRAQEQTLDSLRAAIDQEEQTFENRLVEIYGTPYPDDVGPGKTYAQGYAGPDFVHPMYVELPELFATLETRTFTVPTSLILEEVPNADRPIPIVTSEDVEMNVDTNGLPVKPDAFVGRRSHPGRIQSDVSGYLTARLQLIHALSGYTNAAADLRDLRNLVDSIVEDHDTAEDRKDGQVPKRAGFLAAIAALNVAQTALAGQGDTTLAVAEAITDGFPQVVGLSSDPSFAARSATRIAAVGASKTFKIAAAITSGARAALQAGLDVFDAQFKEELSDLAWETEQRKLLYSVRAQLKEVLAQQQAVDAGLRALEEAANALSATQATGLAIQKEREIFRQRSAAIIQGYRTRDLAFRAFRNEALEKYKTLFDLSARYAFLAARAYDYETGLLDYTRNTRASDFFDQIVRSRAPGVLTNGRPQFGGSSTGDPGLAGALAQLNGDWSVVKGRLGFNNPDRYRTTFSLRTELYRILRATEGDAGWKEALDARLVENILDDADVRRYCAQAGDPKGLAQPGLIIEFPSTITAGFNFFGQPLAGGDHAYTATSFATKIRSVGVAFEGYVGMDSPTSTSGILGSIGATTPASPSVSFTDSNALSATPYLYLIPVGADSLRAPPLGDSGAIRTWQVEDQAIPLPFDISGVDFSTRRNFTSSDSLSESPFVIRKHQSFRAVPTGTVFKSDPGFTNSRLVGRSVWNTRWKLIIPGSTLLSDPKRGLETFTKTVKDIQIHIESYSYSGN